MPALRRCSWFAPLHPPQRVHFSRPGLEPLEDRVVPALPAPWPLPLPPLAEAPPEQVSAPTASLIRPDKPDWILAAQGSEVAGTIARFRALETASAADFHALIDWGDGTELTPGSITGGPEDFLIEGQHDCLEAGLFAVRVHLTHVPTGQAETLLGALVVLTPEQVAGWMGGEGVLGEEGPIHASGPGIDATLFPDEDEGPGLLFVGRYADDPMATGMEGQGFFEVLTNQDSATAPLIIEFALPESGPGNLQLMYFDGNTYRPVGDLALSVDHDTERGKMRAVLDPSKLPTSGELRGTIFTLAPAGTEAPEIITVPLEPTVDDLVLIDLGAPAPPPARMIHFQRHSSLTLTLTPGESRAIVAPSSFLRGTGGGPVQDAEPAPSNRVLAQEAAPVLPAALGRRPSSFQEETNLDRESLLLVDAVFGRADEAPLVEQESRPLPWEGEGAGEEPLPLPKMIATGLLLGAASASRRRRPRWLTFRSQC